MWRGRGQIWLISFVSHPFQGLIQDLESPFAREDGLEIRQWSLGANPVNSLLYTGNMSKDVDLPMFRAVMGISFSLLFHTSADPHIHILS